MEEKKIKLWFFPKAVGDALKSQVLSPSQLNNPELLRDILSDRVVGKIQFMNDASMCCDELSRRVLNVLGLSWITEYACNAKSWSITWIPNNFIAALSEDGDEALSLQINKQIQHFHVPFETVRMGNKEYGIIFGEGMALDDPSERQDYLKRNMEMLLTTVSPELSQEEMLHEPVFSTFINLNV